MAINKVVYGDSTLIDLSEDTLADASELAEGVTAHSRSGVLLTGTGGGGGSSTLAGLDDVDISDEQDNDALVYDSGEWVNIPLSDVALSGSYADLSGKPTLADLTQDTSHQTVSASEKSTWNEKSTVSFTRLKSTGEQIATITINGTSTDIYASAGGSPGTGDVTSVNGKQGVVVLGVKDLDSVDITSIADDHTIVYDSSLYSGAGGWKNVLLPTVALTGSYGDLQNKPTIPAAQVNSDWNANSGVAEILNKPTIPTITTEHTGTASSSAVRKQTITINSTAYDIDGSVYMEGTANSSSFVFTNSTYILSTSAIDVYTDTWGDNPTSVTVDGSAHTCTVTFDAAKSRTVRIYMK